MTFADLKKAVKAVVFPIGEPENLVPIHDSYLIDGLNNIQQYVKCYRDNNVNVISFGDTFYNCGLTVTDAPDGFIKRVYVIGSDGCCKVNLVKSTRAKLNYLEAEYEVDFGEKNRPTQPAGKTAPQFNDLYPDATADSAFGRAITGFWALEGCRLYVWPHLQSTEDLVIEWTGVKDDYADADTIFDSSTQVVKAARLFLQREIARDLEVDPEKFAKYGGEYATALGDLAWRCRQKLEGTHAQEDELPVLVNGCANPALETLGTFNLPGDTVSPNSGPGNLVPPPPPVNPWLYRFAVVGNYASIPYFPPPQSPTSAVITSAGGNINAVGDERYAYFLSYVTRTGETQVSAPLQSHPGSSPNANKANLLSFAYPFGVTSVHVWRTYVDNGHSYDISSFPHNVGLLATVTTGSYTDGESTAQFSGRVNVSIIPPSVNTTASTVASAASVARLVSSWSPLFVTTTGGNTLDTASTVMALDAEVGVNYSRYLNPYFGSYPSGATRNHFWPTLSSYEWSSSAGLTAYDSYFPVPTTNGQYYYDHIEGPVHMFFLDTNANTPDGNGSGSSQAEWLRVKVATSPCKYKLVFMYGSPYSSYSSGQGFAASAWDFAGMGITVIFTGAPTGYERLVVGGSVYINNGLGAAPPETPTLPLNTFSVKEYHALNGAQLVTVNCDSLQIDFYSSDGVVRDTLTIK